MVLVKAIKEGTRDAIKARPKGRGCWFSTSPVSCGRLMEVTSGFRDQYSVKNELKSPSWPCIAICLAKAVKTTRVRRKEDDE